jgi:hypothetical protein
VSLIPFRACPTRIVESIVARPGTNSTRIRTVPTSHTCYGRSDRRPSFWRGVQTPHFGGWRAPPSNTDGRGCSSQKSWKKPFLAICVHCITPKSKSSGCCLLIQRKYRRGNECEVDVLGVCEPCYFLALHLTSIRKALIYSNNIRKEKKHPLKQHPQAPFSAKVP